MINLYLVRFAARWILHERAFYKPYCWSPKMPRAMDDWTAQGNNGAAWLVDAHPGHAGDFAWYRGQRPSPARVIKMSHNNNSRTRKLVNLSRNCKGFRARKSVHARVTESRAQGTGVGRNIRLSPSRVRSVFLLIYGLIFTLGRPTILYARHFRRSAIRLIAVLFSLFESESWPRKSKLAWWIFTQLVFPRRWIFNQLL